MSKICSRPRGHASTLVASASLILCTVAAPFWTSELACAQLPDKPPPRVAEEPAEGPVWSLARVTAASVEQAPDVQRARAALEVARAFRSFGAMPRIGNPILTGRAMIGRPDAPAATYALLLGLPFDWSGKRAAYRKEATWVERQAEADLQVTQNEARSAARTAYVDVAFGEARMKALKLNEETAQDFLSRVRARFDAKAATALDLALSERDYAESVANHARAAVQLADAKREFRQALDLASTVGLEVDALGTPEVPAGLARENVVQLAVEHRREASSFAAAIERKKVSDTRLRRDAIAPLVLAVEGEAQGNNNTQKTVGASLQTELPFVLRNQGDRAVVRAEAELADVERGLAERRVGREAFAAFERLEAVLAELTAIDRQATPAAEQALSMTNEMLEVGAVDVFRVLTARQAAFGLRVRRVEVMRDAWILRIQLERAVGRVEDTR